ncbi:hypothetical protein [Caenimonas soli]|uniref:hypothetical protein n=1 Tax=Caenimonas soli TaxID=2735555 RepID=UPI0015581EDB|nr:hypothetical protein [Caenimonas soli]NPC55888.1 hypothetical protein [Caenimonas soli]
MNVQMNKWAQSARGENLCGYCLQPWFGLVAYCPYCGRKPSFATISQEPDDLPQRDEVVASAQRTLEMPSGELPWALLFKSVIAGVAALLLLWIVPKLLAPRTSEEASAHPPVSTAGIAPPPTRSAVMGAAQAPSMPLRSESAVPPRSSRPPCSVAHEKAGLCKSQQ